MNKKVLGITGLLMVVAMLAATSSMVYAEKSTSVSGSWTITFGTFVGRPVADGDIIIRTDQDTIMLTGDILGTETGTYDRMFLIHNYLSGPSFWKVTEHGLITIEATVDGMSGTLYIKTASNSQKAVDGVWTIVGGTEGLANLHGQGTFNHISQVEFEYEGQVHFDP
jgi:hypothetical protein